MTTGGNPQGVSWAARLVLLLLLTGSVLRATIRAAADRPLPRIANIHAAPEGA